MQIARRRFSAIPAPRTRAVRAHAENLRGLAEENFIIWAQTQKLTDWKSVELRHLTAFLLHERDRLVENQPEGGARKLSSESVYLEIAALRAFYRFAENEKLLPVNVAENLSLPRRWKRLPKALSDKEIEKLLAPELPATPQTLCDQAVLELAYASGLRLAELRNIRLEQLHLDAGFVNVIGKDGNGRTRRACRSNAAIAAINTVTSRPGGPSS